MNIYVVKEGDTLCSIASRNNITQSILLDINQISNPNRLVIGQTLLIPDNHKKNTGKNIAVNGFIYPHMNKSILSRTLEYLTYVTTFTYGFNEVGDIFSLEDEEVLKMSLEENVAPVMQISTLTDKGVYNQEITGKLLTNSYFQDKLISSIITKMKSKRYLGLDIDFECIEEKYRDLYAPFVSKVTQKLNERGYYVFVDLVPKFSSDQEGLLYQSHDYKSLGKAANYVILMTYEWGYTFGPPMAVAPIDKVRQVVSYAVSEIPANKIFLGIPNYGYDWTLPYEEGSTKATNISNAKAVEIAAKYNASIMFDEVAMTPYFDYTDNNGELHQVWFDDARSLSAKLELVNEFNLHGVSYWDLLKYNNINWILLDEKYYVSKILR